jgi:hypothetical protein
MKNEMKVNNKNAQINICKELNHIHNKTSMVARHSIDIALANDEKKLAVKTAADYCIWKAQHLRPTHHMQTRQNIIFDIIREMGYVKPDKIVNTKIIQKLILPECIEYIRKNGYVGCNKLMTCRNSLYGIWWHEIQEPLLLCSRG